MEELQPPSRQLLDELANGGPVLTLVGPLSLSGLKTLEPKTFGLVIDADGALTSLLTQDEQVRAFGHIAASLRENGVFAVATEVPDPSKYPQGQRVRVLKIDLDRVELELTQHHVTAQQVTGTRLMLETGRGGPQMDPFRFRYVWPSELDLMAKLAGLELRSRFTDWERSPFSGTSRTNVSVYTAPGSNRARPHARD